MQIMEWQAHHTRWYSFRPVWHVYVAYCLRVETTAGEIVGEALVFGECIGTTCTVISDEGTFLGVGQGLPVRICPD